ncbi:MAG TPA: hypothetical protein VFG73_03115 [Rhodanobacteraceae bacterium]|nr:hypothetical protein [Rhodanobacteraceae bacterium]
MTADLSAVFESLPSPAWLLRANEPHHWHCNRPAMLLPGAGQRPRIERAALAALFDFTRDGGQALAERLDALLAGAASQGFRAPLAQSPETGYDFVAHALDGEGGRGVLLIASRAADALAPPVTDWWRGVRHDLRGPITPLRMALHLVRSGRVGADDLARTMTMADRQVDLLLATSDDVADMLALQYGQLQLRLLPLDLRQALDKLDHNQGLADALAHRGHALQRVAPAQPVMARIDSLRLQQLLEHLLRAFARRAAKDAPIELTLGSRDGEARLTIGGAEAQLGDDKGLRYIAEGADPGAVPGGLGMQPLLMREIALRHELIIDIVPAQGQLRLRMPLAPDDNDAADSNAADPAACTARP